MIYTSEIANFFGITDRQLIFVSVVAILVIGTLLFLLFFPIRRFINKHRFLYLFYKKIRNVAMDRDFYLINQYVFNADDKNKVMIDHILFGNKFIYLITSKYYEGDLLGKSSDKSLIFISHKGKKQYTDNPIIESKQLTSKLSSSTGLDASLLIGLVLINDDCKVEVQSDSKQFYIIQRKRLPALIKAIESRPVNPINEQQLAKAVQAIAKENKRKK